MRRMIKLALPCCMVAFLAAPALAQGQGRGFGMMGGGGGMLLGNKSVQAEIKATEEQVSKLTTFAEEMRAKQRESFQGLQDLSDDERRTKMQELQKEMQASLDKGLADILKPEQVKRFHQIQLQQAGVNAFMQARVQEAIKLTDEQKEKIQGLAQEMMGQMREIFQEAQGDREAAMKKMTELRKETLEKAHKVLTDEQKTKMKDLMGEHFEVKFEPRPN